MLWSNRSQRMPLCPRTPWVCPWQSISFGTLSLPGCQHSQGADERGPRHVRHTPPPMLTQWSKTQWRLW